MSHNSQVHPSVDEADRRYVWHPCTQMKDHDIAPPLDVVRADGPFIFTRDGKRIIDGISSWWVNLLGHNHPRLTAALCAQAARFPHVMFAGFTHEPAVRLAAELCRIAPGGAFGFPSHGMLLMIYGTVPLRMAGKPTVIRTI